MWCILRSLGVFVMNFYLQLVLKWSSQFWWFVYYWCMSLFVIFLFLGGRGRWEGGGGGGGVGDREGEERKKEVCESHFWKHICIYTNTHRYESWRHWKILSFSFVCLVFLLFVVLRLLFLQCAAAKTSSDIIQTNHNLCNTMCKTHHWMLSSALKRSTWVCMNWPCWRYPLAFCHMVLVKLSLSQDLEISWNQIIPKICQEVRR